MSNQLYRLMQAHQRIDERLRLEQKRRTGSPFVMMRLKKLKLAVKDRLARLTLNPGRA